MHELGVVFEVVKTVNNFKLKNNLSKVDTIVLQIGQLSSMIPKYIQECYPAAVDGTEFEETKLDIEIIPAEGVCRSCSHIFNIIEHRSTCPECQGKDWGLLTGKEFAIKQIIAC